MAFLLDQRPRREPFLRAPASVVGLIAVIVAAHLARMLSPSSVSDEIIGRFAFIPAWYSPAYLAAHGIAPPSLFDLAVPFVSYLFIHANLLHLSINCLWLLAFGPIVARRFGPWLFLLFFFVCGAAAAGLHLALNWGTDAPAVGASGAISGLMAAAIRLLRVGQPFGAQAGTTMLPIFSRQVLLFSAIWLLVNAVTGLSGFGAPNNELIAWQAHMGGYLAGLFLAGPFDTLQGRRLSVA